MKRKISLILLALLLSAAFCAAADSLATKETAESKIVDPVSLPACYSGIEFREEDGPWWVVLSDRKGNRLNLRERPDKHAEYLGKYFSGTVVRQMGPEMDGWIKVQIGPMMGYMDMEYLVPGLEAVRDEIAVVTVNNKSGFGINLRSLPSTEEGDVILSVDNGEDLDVVGVLPNGWLQVMYDGDYYFAKAPMCRPVLLTYSDDIASGVTGIYYVYNPNPQDRLNLRTEPSADASTFARFYGGTPVYAVGFDETLEWAHVHVMELDGWMRTTFLKGKQSQIAMPETTIGNEGALLYLEPEWDDAPGYLAPGTGVRVYGLTDSGWVCVETNDAIGWVRLWELAEDANITWSR